MQIQAIRAGRRSGHWAVIKRDSWIDVVFTADCDQAGREHSKEKCGSLLPCLAAAMDHQETSTVLNVVVLLPTPASPG